MSARRMGSARASARLSTEPILDASGLCVTRRFGETESSVLKDISIALYPGELVAVTGSTPSGPSTLLSCLAGLQEPDAGTVRVNGSRLTGQSDLARARVRARWIGIVSTSDTLLCKLTVAQNVQLAPRLISDRRPPDASEVLTRLGLAHRLYAYPGQLSSAERIRAGLAVALANDPALLLADNPTDDLDEASEAAFFDELRDHARRGKAVVVAGHRAAVAAPADRVLVLENGRLSQ